LRDFPS